jgi:hypothetical protein
MLASSRSTNTFLMTMAARRAGSSSFARPFSTHTVKRSLQGVEAMSKDLRWADVKDEVKTIQLLMDEPKTNHAVAFPIDGLLEDTIQATVREIENLATRDAGGPNNVVHDEVFHRVFDLKRMVKSSLYQKA